MIIGLLACSTFALANLERQLPTSVNSGSTFTVKYMVSGDSAPYFFSIKDVMSGGCTVQGDSQIVTTLTSPATYVDISVKAPSSGTCTFNGDYQLGSASLVNFPAGTVTVSSGGSNNGGSTSDDSGNNSWMWIAGIGIGVVALIAFFGKKNK